MLAAAVIVVAGVFLTRYAEALGEQTRLGNTLAGIILLASATSLPELSVDCNLARIGAVDAAVGDLLGSSLFNLLILAVLDLIHRAPRRMLSTQAAAHALSATTSVLLMAICLIAILTRSQFEWAGCGVGPCLLGLVYVLGLRLVYYDQQHATPAEGTADHRSPGISLRRAAVGYLAAAGVILAAAPRLAHAADGLARATGLGGTFVGTTLVALSTSLPELVTTLAAVRSGAFDLAVGNVFGSNAFNMVILLPVDALYPGSVLGRVSLTHATTAACGILVTAAATLGLLYRVERRIWLIEPDAILVIGLVIGSLALVYASG